MDAYALRHKVRDVVESAVQRAGFDLVAVEWTGNPAGKAVLRLSIDQEPGVGGGVSAGDCARVSRTIEPLLDAADPVKGSYILEVSSPGIERPVQRLADFARFKGYRARIRLEPGPPRRRFTGELLGTRGDDVLISVDGQEHDFHVDTIERAHLDLSLDQFEALGKEGAPILDITPPAEADAATAGEGADPAPPTAPTEDSDDHQ